MRYSRCRLRWTAEGIASSKFLKKSKVGPVPRTARKRVSSDTGTGISTGPVTASTGTSTSTGAGARCPCWYCAKCGVKCGVKCGCLR
jgi:hypothetical protein